MKKNRPPAGEAWVWLTRDLIASDAWRSLGINGRRLIDFLLIENMGKAGTQNGKLKAPHRQLEAFGIGRRLIADAIRETEILGLVECRRAGQRASSTYALTWLPRHDDAPALDYWRGYRNCKLRPLTKPRPKNLPSDGVAGLQSEGVADGANLQSEGVADGPKPYPPKVMHFLERSYQGRQGISGRKRGGGAAACSCPSSSCSLASSVSSPVEVAMSNALSLVKTASGGRL